MLTVNKTSLRRAIKARLAAIGLEERAILGAKAAKRLMALPGWDNFLSVLVFISMNDEIETGPVIAEAFNAGKKVFIPKIDGTMMEFRQILSLQGKAKKTGKALAAEDFPALVLTPGLAFDREGRRLGRGGGYYDRFFAALDSGALTGNGRPPPYAALGLCMETQIVDQVPAGSRDKVMDGLL